MFFYFFPRRGRGNAYRTVRKSERGGGEKKLIRHQITADANIFRSPTAIDRFYTAVWLSRAAAAVSPPPAPPPHPVVPGPNRMCLESKDRCWVHPRCATRARLPASRRRRRLGPLTASSTYIQCACNKHAAVHNVQRVTRPRVQCEFVASHGWRREHAVTALSLPESAFSYRYWRP